MSKARPTSELALVADIGATNARFAFVSAACDVERERVLACKDYPSIEAAIASYLDAAGGPGFKAAAFAVAGPVTDDQVTLTNHPWSFSISELHRHLRLERLHVVNDFSAVAIATPMLRPNERHQVGGGVPVLSAPIGVLGPGSGLGVSGLIPVSDGWRPLSGEGGHATMGANTDRESAVLDRMRKKFDHVSAERVLSGPGLVNLYNALAEIDGAPGAAYSSAQITDPKVRARDSRCHEAVDMFCAMLGTMAANLALTLGARGGVYIAGGIVPKLGTAFADSEFRPRFEDKGRLRNYLERVPTYVVTHPFPAFLGLAALLFDQPSNHRPAQQHVERKPDNVDHDLRGGS